MHATATPVRSRSSKAMSHQERVAPMLMPVTPMR